MAVRFNGWIEPWRLQQLLVSLAQWTNHLVNGVTKVSQDGFVSDIGNSVLLVHITNIVLGVNLWADKRTVPLPMTAAEKWQNIEASLQALNDKGLRINCRVQEIQMLDADKIVYMLLQLARFHIQGQLEPGGGSGKKFPSLILARCRDYLLRSGFGALLDEHPIVNTSKGWRDGVHLTALALAIAPQRCQPLRKEAFLLAPAAEASMVRAVTAITGALDIPRVFNLETFVDQPEECAFEIFLGLMLSKLQGGVSDAADDGQVTHAEDRLRRTIQSLNARVIELEEACTGYTKENEALQIQIYDLSAASMPAREQIERLQQELDDLRNESGKMNSKIAAAEASRDLILAEATARLQRADEMKAASEERLREAMDRSLGIAKQCKQLKIQFDALIAERTKRTSETVPPPEGNILMMFTDIEGSTALWENDATEMAEALRLHNQIVRECIELHSGYEVKTEGDAFMVAFQDIWGGVRCAVKLQHLLLHAPWSATLLATKNCAPTYDSNGTLIWRGLRIRIGLHAGAPEMRVDPTTERADYFGPAVNRAARIESVAAGGQIAISETALEPIAELIERNSDVLTVQKLGEFELKGIRGKIHISLIHPTGLQTRLVGDAATSASVVKMAIGETPQSISDKLKALEDESALISANLVGISSAMATIAPTAETLLADMHAKQAELTSKEARDAVQDGIRRVRMLESSIEDLRGPLEDALALQQTWQSKFTATLQHVAELRTLFSRMPSLSIQKTADVFIAKNVATEQSRRERVNRQTEAQARRIDALESECRGLRSRLREYTRVRSGSVATGGGGGGAAAGGELQAPESPGSGGGMPAVAAATPTLVKQESMRFGDGSVQRQSSVSTLSNSMVSPTRTRDAVLARSLKRHTTTANFSSLGSVGNISGGGGGGGSSGGGGTTGTSPPSKFSSMRSMSLSRFGSQNGLGSSGGLSHQPLLDLDDIDSTDSSSTQQVKRRRSERGERRSSNESGRKRRGKQRRGSGLTDGSS